MSGFCTVDGEVSGDIRAITVVLERFLGTSMSILVVQERFREVSDLLQWFWTDFWGCYGYYSGAGEISGDISAISVVLDKFLGISDLLQWC